MASELDPGFQIVYTIRRADGTGGASTTTNTQYAQSLMNDPRFIVTQNTDSHASGFEGQSAATPSDTSGGTNDTFSSDPNGYVNPGGSAWWDQQQLALQGGGLAAQQQNADTSKYNADTQRMDTMGNQLYAARGPANAWETSLLMRGRPDMNYPSYVAAVQGLTSGNYLKPLQPTQLTPETYSSTGIHAAGGFSGVVPRARTAAPIHLAEGGRTVAPSQDPTQTSYAGTAPNAGPMPNVWALVDQYASDHAWDPRVLRALVMAESGGDPNAVGDNGNSIGLLQANMAGGRGKGYTADQLKDPNFNLQLGMNEMDSIYHDAVARGLSGADLAVEVARLGQRPAAVTLPRYAEAYNNTAQTVGDPSLQSHPAIAAARGITRVVTRPTAFTVNGQRFVTGEHGRDEMVTVAPLQQPAIAVDPQTAAMANAIHPEGKYVAHPGIPPGSGPLAARVLAALHAHAQMRRAHHLASGGSVLTYGQPPQGSPPAVIAPSFATGDTMGGINGAVVNGQYVSQPTTNRVQPGGHSFSDGSMISSSGQVYAPSTVAGQYTMTPVLEATPYRSPTEYQPHAMAALSPYEQQMLTQLGLAKGDLNDPFWTFDQSLPKQTVPVTSGYANF